MLARVRPPISIADLPGATFGDIVAAYRRRRRQPHRDLPWSQEDLAFACGTSQAQISRIESNRQHPECETLVRICGALGMSLTEQADLLARAGYQMAVPPPDSADVAHVLSRLTAFIDACPYPALLTDENQRTWYANRLVADIWGQNYGAADQAGYLDQLRGRPTIDVIFDPDQFRERLPRWLDFFEDLDTVLMRHVIHFWHQNRGRLADPDIAATLARLQRNPEFVRLWERIEGGETGILFYHLFPHAIRHPHWGRLAINGWRTTAAFDERFIVSHLTAADRDTAGVFETLRASHL